MVSSWAFASRCSRCKSKRKVEEIKLFAFSAGTFHVTGYCLQKTTPLRDMGSPVNPVYSLTDYITFL